MLTPLSLVKNVSEIIYGVIKNNDIIILPTLKPLTKFRLLGAFLILKKVIKTSDVVMIDQSEARMITAENNLKAAGYKIMKLSSKNVVIKKGEHGVLVFTPNNQFALPGFLTNNVKDPTGAGDSFAGAFFGFLDSVKSYDDKNIFLASVFGTIVASYTVENFGVKSLLDLNIDLIYQRYKDYLKLIGYEYILNEIQFNDYLNL